MNNLFTIIFEDNTSFVGGNLTETKWLEIPVKKIKRIFYKLPYGDCLCLSGYDAYYHMVEATMDLSAKNKGNTKLHFAYIMGRLKENIIIYKIALKNTDKYVTIDKKNINDKWIQKLNVNGWK